MADIELVIKIPEEAKQAFDCAESNDLKGCYYDHGGIIGNAIKNGTPLPEHHGDLKDVDKLIPDMCETIGCGYQAVSCMQIDLAPTIIPATGNEFFNFDAPIIKKQTATKEEKRNCENCIKAWTDECEEALCFGNNYCEWKPTIKEGAE